MKAIFAAVAFTAFVVPTFAQQASDTRFLRASMGGELMAQFTYKSAEMCKAVVDGTNQQAAAGKPLPNAFSMACSSTDVSSILPFQTTLRDEFYGHEVPLATKTELMCLTMTSSLAKEMAPGTTRPIHTVLLPCKLRS